MFKKIIISALAVLSITSTGCANTKDDPYEVDYNDAWMMIDKNTNHRVGVVFSPVVIGDFKNPHSLMIDAVECDTEFKMCVSYQHPYNAVTLEKVSYKYARKSLGLK